MHISDRFSFQKLTPARIQILCMGFVAAVTAYILPIGLGGDPSITYLSVTLLTAAAVLFLSTFLQQPLAPDARLLLKIGGAFVLWLAILTVVDALHYPSGVFYGPRFSRMVPFLEYLMLLPFAALRREEKWHWGLLLMGGAYCIGCAGLLIYFAMQLLNIVPEYLAGIICRTTTEMRVAWRANFYATIFMIAIGFQLYFACLTKKRWLKILLILSLLPGFCAIALAQSRAILLCSASIAAGAAFFSIYPGGFQKKNLVRLFIGLLVAILVFGILVAGMWELDHYRMKRLHAQQVSTSDTSQQAAPGKAPASNSLLLSLKRGIYNRFYIIKTALANLVQHPETLLLGQRQQVFTYYELGNLPVAHSHNSWVQTLLETGVIGLLLALVLTFIAIKDSFRLMFSTWAALSQKVIAMIAIAILISELVETYLFFTEFPENQVNMVFVLCVGYVVYWVRGARHAAAAED